MLDRLRPPWMAHAACAGAPVSVFFPDPGLGSEERREAYEVALGYCRPCPVRRECVDYAEHNEVEHGVFGEVPERRAGWRPRRRRTEVA